jgi:phosphatidate cytidylyltransferase
MSPPGPPVDAPAPVEIPPIVSSELGRRCATAALLVPVVLAATFAGGAAFMAIVAIGAGLVAIEWTRLTGPGAGPRAGLVPLSIILAVWAALVASGIEAALVAVAVGMAAGLVLAPRVGLSPVWCAAGVGYVGFAGLALVMLRESDGPGLAAMIWLFCLVWFADIAAFAFGRFIGGPRLAPAVSPAKTWAGALAAVAAAALVGLAAASVVGETSAPALALVSAGVGIAAVLGDLVESWIKRRFGAKNAGNLFPGHGGMMDRVDSLIFAALAAAAAGASRSGIGAAAWGILQW